MDAESRYEFLEKIGSGSFSTVYRARDLELGREVAVKQIHQQYLDDPNQLDRYWQEAQLLASLQHPNIVTIFDIHRERGWLILELMQANLADRMAGKAMDLRALRSTLACCLRALKYLHARGVVHGDIKPSNMMIDARRRVKIGDFGLARRVSDEDGSLLKGTTKYMAPEAVSDEFGAVGPPSDLYSLGFAAYDLMCGDNFESLFPGLGAFGRNKQIAWMMWHAARDRRLPPIDRVLEGVPSDLAHVIEKLSTKEPSERYQSADKALVDLNVDTKVIKPGAESDDGLEEPSGDEEPSKRNRLLILGAVLACSLLLSVAMIFWPSGSGDEPVNENVAWVVSEVYTDENAVKVEDPDGELAKKIALGEEPRIRLKKTGENILLEELRPGDRIEFRTETDAQGRRIRRIIAVRPETDEGRIERNDEQQRRVTVAVEEGDFRGTLPLRVTKRTKVFLNGKKAELSQLRSGLDVTFDHVEELGERTGRIVEAIHARELINRSGWVTDVDAGGRRMSVRFGRDMTNSILLPFAEKSEILLQREGSSETEAIAVTDVKKGDHVSVWYDEVFHKVVVTRDRAKMTGRVEAVDASAGELTVVAGDGTRLTFGIPESVEQQGNLTLSAEAVRLEDLRENDTVDVTYDDSDPDRPLASSVFATRHKRFDRWGIVITVSRFDEPTLSSLNEAGSSGQLIRDTLVRRYAVPAENPDDMLLFLNNPSKETMQKQIAELLAKVPSGKQLIVYIASHGYIADDGRTYIAGSDLEWDQISQTGLPLDWLVQQIEDCPADKNHKIVLLDLCHTGYSADLERQPSTEEMLKTLRSPPESSVLIGNTSRGERGRKRAGAVYSYFAEMVSRGYGGEADVDRDLMISAEELWNFLQTEMPKTALDGQSQTPTRLPSRG